ncbi:GNAT family N-acetyltransferase [Candidatus Bathyarchaeota archaeon]|nr:MAG: GNAT family N-acetyltransferase [Candidatus Bathyarchaeota archaeon]
MYLVIRLSLSYSATALLSGTLVALRALEREDLTVLHKWQNDEEIMRLARSFPDHVISKEALEAEFARELKGEDTGRRAYIIEEKSTRKPVGWATIRIQQFRRRMTGADVGLALGEKTAWNKGYGTETAKLLLNEVFRQLNLHRAEWWTYAENNGSVQLAKKPGFKEEARLRDAVFFDNRYPDLVVLGLLKQEFESIIAAAGTSSGETTVSYLQSP